MIAFLYPVNRKNIMRCFWTILICSFISVLIMILFYKDYLGVAYRSVRYDSNLDQSAIISPLVISYMGSFAGILSVWVLLKFWNTWSPKNKLVIFLLIAPCIFLLFYGGSRGAFFALTVCLSILFVTEAKIKYPIVVCAIFVVMAFYLLATQGSSQQEHYGMVSRVFTLFEELKDGGEAGAGRTEIWKSTVDQFAESPLTGSGFFEKTTESYPHNHILEAFMST